MKRGGRESGEQVPRVRSQTLTADAGGLSAAADPAAPSFAEDIQFLSYAHSHPHWLDKKCASCQAAQRLMERYRALEAENARLRAITRDGGHGIACPALLTRAERTEDRVRELEAELEAEPEPPEEC